MSSYADIAAKGPKQSDAEKVPPQVSEIRHEDSGVHTIGGGLSPSPNAVPSYADQQLAHERAEEAEEEARREADKAAEKVREFEAMTDQELSKLEKEGGQKWQDFKKYSTKKYNQFKKEAGIDADKAKKNAKKAEQWMQKNKTHPVVLGNALIVSLVAGIVGFRAYKLQQEGWNWNVGAALVGGVAAFAAADTFFTRYLFQRYPPK